MSIKITNTKLKFNLFWCNKMCIYNLFYNLSIIHLVCVLLENVYNKIQFMLIINQKNPGIYETLWWFLNHYRIFSENLGKTYIIGNKI